MLKNVRITLSRTPRRRYVGVSYRGLQAYLVTRSIWGYFDKSIAIGPWNCSAQIRRIREMHLTKMRNTNLEKFQNTPAPDSWRRSSEKTSSCGVKINIDSGVKCMAGKPMKTRIRVWREFGGGRKRGGGRPPGEIISMIFLCIALVCMATAIPNTKEHKSIQTNL